MKPKNSRIITSGLALVALTIPMKPKFNRFLALLAVFAAFTHASAADLFWDADGDATTATGGSGTWTAPDTWRDGSDTGTLGDWANDNNAVFGGTLGTVTLGGSVSVSRLTFNQPTGNYIIGHTDNSTDAISFSGSYGTGNPAIAGTAPNANINSKITGTITGGLVINVGEVSATDLGRITFGNTANDFIGDITVLSGKIALDDAAHGNAANKLILNGGGIRSFTGNATVTYSRAIEIGAAGANLAVSASSGTIANITLSGPITGSATWNHLRGSAALGNAGVTTVILTGDMSGFTGNVNVASSQATGTSTTIQTSATSNGSWTVSTGGQLTLNTTDNTHIANGAGKSNLLMAGGTLTMNGRSETINGLSGATGTVRNNAASTTSTLTLGDGDATATFGGTLINGNGSGNVLALTKIGDGTQTLSGTNTYTGGTTINEGTLVIGNGAALGSLVGSVAVNALGTLAYDRTGAPTFTNAITGDGNVVNRKSLIVYTGDMSAFAGTFTALSGSRIQFNNDNGSANASWVVNGAVTTNQGLTLTMGALSGNSGGDIGRGGTAGSSPLLVVGALNTDTTYAGLIRDEFGVTKVGSGRLTLSGANNTYTGGTEVDAGTLVITESLPGVVTVNSGATLVGGTSISGNITVKSGGSLAAGLGITTLNTIGTVTLEPGAIFAAQIDSATATADQIFANASVTLTGASLSLSDIATTPAPIPVGTKLTLIDYDTLTLTGTFAGLPEGSTVAAGINSFTLSYADDGAVTLTALASGDPFAIWAAGAGLDGSPGKEAGFDDDPDGDGVANGLEWILNGNPLDGQSGSLVTPTTASTANGLTLAFTRNEDSIGVATLTLEYNTDLGPVWQSLSIGAATSGPDANGVTVTIDTAATPDQVTVNIPAANAPNGKIFARLNATK